MSNPNAPDFNPYASPSLDASRPPVTSNDSERRLLKQFREQILALGALWIILGVIAFCTGVFMFLGPLRNSELAPMVSGVLFVTGAVWISLGTCTCLKMIWAVYVGLVLSYISAIGNLVNFNLCGLLLLGAAILQAHRVLGWAKELNALGIPLTTRPQDITTPINIQPPFV